MSKIVAKLNLNKTPQLVDNNSLVFAKNIRLLKDNTIGPDTSLEEVETNTGDATHHVVHHNEVTQTTTRYFYTILQYKEVLALNNGNSLTEHPEYNFSIDSQTDPYDDNYNLSDRATYVNRLDVHQCSISCYDLGDTSANPMHPMWIQPVFRYNGIDNRLEDTSGLMFLIGIREEEVNNTTLAHLHAPKFFYFIGPRQYEGITLHNVFDTGANFVVFNPVYKTVTTNTTVIQPAYDEEWDDYDTVKYIGQIVGLNNKIYFFKESNYIKFTAAAKTAILAEYTTECFVGDTPATGQTATFDVDANSYITRNGVLFRDSSIAATLFPDFNDRVKIFEYDEVANTFSIVKCAWKYSGGKINGCASVNGSGEIILTICEYDFEDNSLIPIKHINLDKCTESDNESFYTQAPNIPISNLRLSGRYIKNIPAGVYQFFIRYKIRDGFYTKWFPCSKELFAGSRKITDTLQGSIKHTDLHEDSNNSFIFTIEHLYPQYCADYEQFQLGFILSAEGGMFARSWKHFDMTLASNVSIYFDYIKTDIEDINIDDLLKANYDVFNVKNVAQYKNRLYIANYIETNFNDSVLYNYANNVKVSFDLLNIQIAGHYLNNIPLNEGIDGIYTTFSNIPISSIYYDSAYCMIENNINQTSRTSILLEIVPLDGILHNSPYHFPTRIKKITLYDENNNPYVIEEYFDDITEQNAVSIFTNYLGITVPNEQPDTLINTIIDEIKNLIIGINSNGDFVANINNSEVIIKNFEIEYVSWGDVESNIVASGGAGSPFSYSTYYTQPVITKTLKTNVSLRASSFTTDYVYNEYNTFLPFTKYDFYIHYVKQNGIITNGYYITTKEINRYCKQYKPVETEDVPFYVINAIAIRDGTVTILNQLDSQGNEFLPSLEPFADLSYYTPDSKTWAVILDSYYGHNIVQAYKLEEITTDDFIIIANFANIECPPGYVGCFISYTKHGNNVAQGYNYFCSYDPITNAATHKLDCLELNCLLYNTNINIEVKNSRGITITDSANYYASGTTQPIEYLGGSGHVEFVTINEFDNVPIEETEVTNIQEWHPDNKTTGYYDGSGSWHNSLTTNNVYRYRSVRIDVSGHKRVRFLGYASNNANIAYALTDENGDFLDSYPKTYRDESLESGVVILKEYVIEVESAKYLVCLIKNGDTGILQPDNFYCYFQDYASTTNEKQWLLIDELGKPDNKQLIKLTPFIKLDTANTISYLNSIDLNSPGYFCEVITLLRDRCNYPNGYYVSGNDVYNRYFGSDGLKLELNETRINYEISSKSYIYSNYNLNYVSLTNDLTPIIRRYNISREGDTQQTSVEEGLIQSSEKQLITVVNSLLASYILELKSFFREYTRKTYQEYTTNKIIKFDNTIRVSSVDVDEIYRYIYTFEATDYYNVPTHRGIITNLVSVANTLYSHCEHSLFKFTDNKTLTGQNEEVTLQENDIFNTGISEVFDAQYGYGGLKNREQSLVTFNAYVFYDDVTKIIYAFGGEQQIANIGEPIQKIIDKVNPTDVRFVADELNDRFFVNLRNNEGNVCLSFNFRAKSFISIHDLDFKFGFHSRRHTYFEHDNTFGNDVIGWSIYRITDKLTLNNKNYFIAYQNCYTPSLISITDMPQPLALNAASACIDVITNVEYEKIKTLNYINWICSEILDYGNDLNFKAEEELNRLYTGDKLRIYSDSSSTDLLELTDANGVSKLANEQRNIDSNGNIIPVKESWQYPVYNCGVFSLNYFRNIIKNGNVYTSQNPDLFDYKNINNVSQQGLINLTEYPQRLNLTQENSLIYGKYFVFRLIFTNRNFKIENITFRMNDYGKTK